ncbi:hypothetical protein [Streptosporangium pseudovulgare]|uniref:hypothetical protein n=1 Tax=Streptosporangium pseudovulgare TaxID=35765 RepID=UPI0035712BE4
MSHGTLYNLYGTREALIDEVVTDLAAGRLDEVAEHALSFGDAWDGFAYYIEKVCELQGPWPTPRYSAATDVGSRWPGHTPAQARCGHCGPTWRSRPVGRRLWRQKSSVRGCRGSLGEGG